MKHTARIEQVYNVAISNEVYFLSLVNSQIEFFEVLVLLSDESIILGGGRRTRSPTV